MRVVDGKTERLVVMCFKFTLAMCEMTPRGWREHSFTYLVTASSLQDVFEQVNAATVVLVQNLSLGEVQAKPYLGALHVWEHDIMPLGPDGRPVSRGSIPLFEWKHDFPGTLADHQLTAVRKHTKTRKASGL